jgi:hypothetical protein
MIPKIIHYCWLSNDSIPENYQKCRDTWNEKLHGYEFILWDTARFDINSLAWTKQAFEQKRYAFAADYIRFYAVYHHGGIYLDMDIEVVKSFDELLNQKFMLAYENHINDHLEAGCFGAEKNNPFIRECMRYYENREFSPILAPIVMRNAMNMAKPTPNKIYSYDYFTTKNMMTGLVKPTKNTFAIHHFVSDYAPKSSKLSRKVKQKIRARIGEKNVVAKVIIMLYNIMVFPVRKASNIISYIKNK